MFTNTSARDEQAEQRPGKDIDVPTLCERLQEACIGPYSVVRQYVTYKDEPAINLRVLSTREALPGCSPYPPYLHIGWVPGKWARGTIFTRITRDSDSERLRYTYTQVGAWYQIVGEQLVVDLLASAEHIPPGRTEHEIISALRSGAELLNRLSN